MYRCSIHGIWNGNIARSQTIYHKEKNATIKRLMSSYCFQQNTILHHTLSRSLFGNWPLLTSEKSRFLVGSGTIPESDKIQVHTVIADKYYLQGIKEYCILQAKLIWTERTSHTKRDCQYFCKINAVPCLNRYSVWSSSIHIKEDHLVWGELIRMWNLFINNKL